MAKPAKTSVKGTRQACDACHFKKIRCLRASAAGERLCQRCDREGIPCVFSPALKTGRPRKAAASEKRSSSKSTSQPSSDTSASNSPSFSGMPDSHQHASNFENSAIPWDEIDAGTVCFLSMDCPFHLDEAFTDLKTAESPQLMVLMRLEQLTAFQQQLVAKRREHGPVFSKHPRVDASPAVQELLQITRKVGKFSTWLMMGGSKFASRRPMLSSMSDETALMMVVSPATLVLDVFGDILELAFPSLKDGYTEPEIAASDGEESLCTINPALLSVSDRVETCQSMSMILPNVGAVHDLANPVCIYILLTALQEQLDDMRRAADMTLNAFPRMNSATGAQGLLPVIMDQYLEKIRFVQEYINRANGDNLMTGIN
ncbi:C6 zinc finger domain protein [Colletotrichum truncatum]|uniref:C6 zinc finger domain protein n=1 Tax=Colletotrichum truncatum TaxID=5467 RepID=A0ACC3YT26_COLTU|nr:C6 zinc finger domain protein [Colletotrichum truncatum]KAF6785155.1 C6 zinc finger domain protein [Colletotrichum truncatum]